MENIPFNKLLHQLIDRLLDLIVRYSHTENVEVKKLFSETLRRRKVVGNHVRALALEVHETLDDSITHDIDTKIENIWTTLLQADFFESAVNFEMSKFDLLSEEFTGNVHNLIYVCALEAESPNQLSPGMANANFLPSKLTCNFINEEQENVDSSFSSSLMLTSNQSFWDFPMAFQCGTVNLSSLPSLPSLQLENMQMDFESQINMSRGMWNQIFSEAQINNFSHEEKSGNSNNISPKEHDTYEETELFTPSSCCDDIEILLCNTELPPPSWESCIKHSVREHRYVTDLFEDETPSLITSYSELSAFQELYCFNGLIERDVMLLYALDMLIGLPSIIFPYSKEEKRFHIKVGIHLPSISHEATEKFFSEAICVGSMFCRLEHFAEESGSIGFIMNGLKVGVKQILETFREYIFSLKSNAMKFSDLQGVVKSAELIVSLARICGISPEFEESNPLPKSSELLSYLKKSSSSHTTKEMSVMIAVLMKYVLAPCLRFMNQWIFEGIYEDPNEEFFIQADERFIYCRDETFWTHAYFLRNSNQKEIIQSDLQVLNCGKSIKLLKLCCPEHPTLRHMERNPPPPLSISFSFNASMQKAKSCMAYIKFMESALKQDEKSEEVKLLFSQELLSFEEMRTKVHDRWSLLLEASKKGENVFSLKSASDLQSSLSNLSIKQSERSEMRRHKSEFNLHAQEQMHHLVLNFSGALCGEAGIIFSSCGFESKQSALLNKEVNSSILSRANIIDWLHFNRRTELTLELNKGQQEHDHLDLPYGNNARPSPLSTGFSQSSSSGFYLKSPRDVDEGTQFFKSLGRIQSNDSLSRPSQVSGTDSSCDTNAAYASLCPFAKRLVPLLCDGEYNELEEDVNACVQMNNMTNVMFNSLNPILMLQTALTHNVILDYLVNHLRLDELLLSLRNLYFFQDEGFSQSFCEQMFKLVTSCKMISQFCNYRILSELLSNALADSSNTSLMKNNLVKANLQGLPDNIPELRGTLLHFVRLDFTVEWPHNIIVSQSSIESYNRIFSILLYIEYVSWILGKAWEVLKLALRQNPTLSSSTEFRNVMRVRREMEHYARSVCKSVHYELHCVVRKQLTNVLFNLADSIDSMIEMHTKYLNSALERCFLTKTTSPFHNFFMTTSFEILKFCQDVMKIDPQSGIIDSDLFTSLKEVASTFLSKKGQKDLMMDTIKKHWARSSWDDCKEYLLSCLGELI